jgi:hypothetical protein
LDLDAKVTFPIYAAFDERAFVVAIVRRGHAEDKQVQTSVHGAGRVPQSLINISINGIVCVLGDPAAQRVCERQARIA